MSDVQSTVHHAPQLSLFTLMQVGIDMSKFREFPYRGSLLQSQNGSIQEVRHRNKLILAMDASTFR